MEVFMYQYFVFVAPVLLAVAGYGFQLNTSTLLVLTTAAIVLFRAMFRWWERPLSFNYHCTDDTLDEVEGGNIGMQVPTHSYQARMLEIVPFLEP